MNLETSSPRRDFLRATALAGGGLVIGFLVPGARRFAMAQEATAAAPTAFVPNAFLSIAADDTITAEESAELNEIGKELGFTAGEVDAVRMDFADQLSAIQRMRRGSAGAQA